jgi:hypothetical protein
VNWKKHKNYNEKVRWPWELSGPPLLSPFSGLKKDFGLSAEGGGPGWKTPG